MTRTLAALSMAAAAVAGSGGAAAAAEMGDPFRVSIAIADLDLSSESGQKALAKRARATAERVCAAQPYPTAYDIASLRECEESFEAAVKAAITRYSER